MAEQQKQKGKSWAKKKTSERKNKNCNNNNLSFKGSVNNQGSESHKCYMNDVSQM